MCAASDRNIEVFVLRDNGQYDRYQTVTQGTGRQLFVQGQPSGTVNLVPPHSVPAEMGTQQRNGQRPVQLRAQQHRHRTRDQLIEQPTTFDDFVKQQGAHIQQTMQYLDQSNATAAKIITQLYTAKQLVAGTDGGLLNDDGTFGYVWANPENIDVLAKGHGNVPGQPVGKRTWQCSGSTSQYVINTRGIVRIICRINTREVNH
jgi:hypothetical protein